MQLSQNDAQNSIFITIWVLDQLSGSFIMHLHSNHVHFKPYTGPHALSFCKHFREQLSGRFIMHLQSNHVRFTCTCTCTCTCNVYVYVYVYVYVLVSSTGSRFDSWVMFAAHS